MDIKKMTDQELISEYESLAETCFVSDSGGSYELNLAWSMKDELENRGYEIVGNLRVVVGEGMSPERLESLSNDELKRQFDAAKTAVNYDISDPLRDELLTRGIGVD